MGLGPRRHNPEWEDMSNYVVHFTKRTRDRSSAENMAAILEAGRIEARNRFGIGRRSESSPAAVCLSETPIHLLTRVMRRYGAYGLGFDKRFIVASDGGPIFYAYGRHAAAANTMFQTAAAGSEVWSLAPFIDWAGDRYQFEWEREWRVPGDLVFDPGDVSFAIFPEAEHERVRAWLTEEAEAGRLPAYNFALIDVGWAADRVREVIG